jgi:hypothetical protein
MALYDTMLSLKSPIGTHCLGFAFNLAGFILAAGQKVWVVKYILLSALCLFFDAHYNFFLYYFIQFRVHVLVCLFAGFHFNHLLEQLEARSGLSRSFPIIFLLKVC